jgi:25S rRNA (uracil2634-N3)-methyltransferase
MAKPKPREKPHQRHRTTQNPQKFKKPPQKQPKQAAPKPTIPFNPYDDILLVGEGLPSIPIIASPLTSPGDFSFAASLVADHGATSLLATTLDDSTASHAKHPAARGHLDGIAAAFDGDGEQRVLYAVDATQLHKHKLVRSRPWTRIVFNFPHVGGRSTDVNRQVRANQALLAGFFSSARALLEPPPPDQARPPRAAAPSAEEGGGASGDVNSADALAQPTILVTVFDGEPYTLWNVRDLARHAGLAVLRSFRFPAEAYPTYRHSRTLGVVLNAQGEPSTSAWKGEERPARMYEFGLKPAEQQDHGNAKKGRESSDED